MRMKSELLQLHFAVLLLGMTGLFGKFLDLSPVTIIAGRSLFTALFLAALMWWLKESFALKNSLNALRLFGSGLVLCLHWHFFFLSIQTSTVAIGVIGFSTYPIFVTFLEPLFFREKIQWVDIASGILVFLGLLLVVPKFDFQDGYTQALLYAVLSGFILAIFTLMNRQLIKQNHYLSITFYQHLAAFIVTIPIVAYLGEWPNTTEIGLLVVLGVLFTAIPQSMLVKALHHVKAQLASVSVGLEPVYSIIFAVILLNEVPSFKTVMGGIVVLGAVALATQLHVMNKKKV